MELFAYKMSLLFSDHFSEHHLWADIFAACIFLELYRCVSAENYRQLVLGLIDQVHEVVGRNCDDDPWSG
jgi:hypothetical protein